MAKTNPGRPLSFQRAFNIIKEVIHTVSSPCKGEVVHISEGSQTMDMSRSIFHSITQDNGLMPAHTQPWALVWAIQ